MSVFLVLAALGVLGSQCGSVESAPVFDFTFVDAALQYLDTGDEAVLVGIVESPGAKHLAAHASLVSLGEQERSTREIVEELLQPRLEKAEYAREVRQLLRTVRQDTVRQAACLSEVLAYLPEGTVIRGRLYFTYGYDIGVAVSGNASLNLAHAHFLQDPGEVWFYCVHELHHAGFQLFHDMPKIAELATTHDLLCLIEYATQLEGMAVYAAWNWRERAGALSGDEDYEALQDDDRMARYEREYFEMYRRLRSEPVRPLADSDWAIIERMSSGDRLWYRVGARIAATIEATQGRGELLRLVEAGPTAFIDAYRAGRVERALPN